MAIIRCPHGHFYDDNKYESCPVCSSAAAAGPRWTADEEKTVSLDWIQKADDEEQTVRLTPEDRVGGGFSSPTRLRGPGAVSTAKYLTRPCASEQVPVRGGLDSEKTVSFHTMGEKDLLAGWLVCTAGPSRGQDFKVYPGFNRIGRDWDADVCIQDPAIARANHCAVVYDAKSARFYLVPGKGTLTWLQEKAVEQAVELAERTPFCFGKSTLELVAFCRGEHTWETI